MLEFMQMIKEMHPGIFIHSIHIKENIEEDQKAGWVCLKLYSISIHTYLNSLLQFGNVNEQVEFVFQQIANITELKDGFDALGFSQGTINIRLIL